MGFSWDGDRTLEDLFDDDPLDRALHRIADRVQDFLHDRVTHHTPVAQPPPGVSPADWIQERGGRPPRTLKQSWEKSEHEILALDHIIVTVQTFDPIAPYVEEPTRPHAIHGNPILRFRDRQTGDVIFTREIHHPGTEGSHMMAKALQETAAYWPTIVREEFARWEREQFAAA